MGPTEIEERARLENFQARIQDVLRKNDARLTEHAQEIQNSKAYLWEARRDMDHIEKIAVRQTIEQTMGAADVVQAQQKKLVKLTKSPYFGRVDFLHHGDTPDGAIPVY
ncbi:MAG: hypothetical protein WD672_09575, partial [Woeseia sp.]